LVAILAIKRLNTESIKNQSLVEGAGKDSAWESILFEAHNSNDLLRGGSPRKSAVAVISAAATAETALFRQARGKGVRTGSYIDARYVSPCTRHARKLTGQYVQNCIAYYDRGE
jgi:hypothetical protein